MSATTDLEQWKNASILMKNYIQSNQRQVQMIFAITVLLIFLGFIIIVVGAVIGGGQAATVFSGVVTEFLGASVLIIYRSVCKQADHYVSILDRVTSTEIAMHIISTSEKFCTQDDGDTHLQSWMTTAKMNIAKAIIAGTYGVKPENE